MSEFTKQIEELIGKVVTEQTFSLEAVEQIKNIKDQLVSLEKELERKNNSIESKNTAIANLEKANEKLQEKKDELLEEQKQWKARESSVAAREGAIKITEQESHFHNMRVNDMKEIIGIVFKNPIVRREIHDSKSVPINMNGYVQHHTESSMHQEIETTE